MRNRQGQSERGRVVTSLVTSPAMRLVGMGFYVAFCIAGGVIGGALLDRVLGTGTLFALLGLLAGLTLAVVGSYLLLMDVLNATRTGRKDGT